MPARLGLMMAEMLGAGAIADVVEVQHALDGIGLIAVDEGFRVSIKENVILLAVGSCRCTLQGQGNNSGHMRLRSVYFNGHA